MTASLETSRIVEALARLLQTQLDAQDRLLKLIRRKRQAITAADVATLNECCREEEAAAGRLETLEMQRRALIAELTTRLAGERGDPLTVRELAERVDEPLRARLQVIAVRLRESVETVRRESSIVRAAADALARHLGGLMQTMQSALGKAAVYGREGRLTNGAQLDFNVDLKT